VPGCGERFPGLTGAGAGAAVGRAGAGAKLDAGLAGTFASADDIVLAGTRLPL
jgi:hypothetical protein